ncbi:uncharacterized protein LOC110703789 [Chenopodium quinoa]|uniref:uncharacterized protein LOC110703789 n=1 Tax=Chenopodium quinoa TaxID=63459 RepID=UPI000B77B480|nr:uncharacterized protein LOC110703789 [Chenopodium quinoa]
MGNMSVTEYYTKFIELSQFAKEFVSTEKSKVRKFESGLTTDLQLKVCGQVFETLDEVYGRAAHLYALELKKKKEIAEIEGKEKIKEVGHNSGNPQGNNRQGGQNFNGGARNSTQGNNRGARHFYCKRCKKDHPGKDCDGNLVTCRACNKLGHMEYECFSKDPNRNKQGNNQGGAQRNFQGSNNHSGNKGAQQNAAITNNNNGNNQQKGGAAGKLNVMSRHEADSTKNVITGGVVKCNKTFRDVPLEIKGNVFLSDLIEFGLSDFDVILGMDWLSRYSAEISCRPQKV